MNCAECREQLVAYAEGLVDDAGRRAIEAHLDSCPECRAESEGTIRLRERLLANGKRLAAGSMVAPVMDRILRQQTRKVRRYEMLWRYKGRLGIAVAAAAVLAAGLISVIVNRTSTTAYAIEQTVEASKDVRTVHMREILVDEEWLGKKWNVHREYWAQFGDDGKPTQVRMDVAPTADGHKVVIWEGNLVHVWFRDKGGFVTTSSRGGPPGQIEGFRDPKAVVDELYQAQSAGKALIEQDESTGGWAPIRLTVTRFDSGSVRKVYLVNSRTKLLEQVDTCELVGGADYKLVSSLAILDYDQPINPKVFKPDLPEGVMKLDETKQVIGLPRGSLSDKEIAAKVAREFFEAMIAEDYAKAGQLFSGIPADRMESMFKKIKFIRIVSIGEPVPHPIPAVRGLVVPSTVEVEAGGQKTVTEFRPAVRAVGGPQPDNWAIHGGI